MIKNIVKLLALTGLAGLFALLMGCAANRLDLARAGYLKLDIERVNPPNISSASVYQEGEDAVITGRIRHSRLKKPASCSRDM